MRIARFAVAAALATVLTPVSARAQIFDRCEHVRQLNNSVALTVGPLLRVNAGAGTLRIRGVEGLREARIRGTACASSAALLDQLSVAVERGSSAVTIETRFPEQRDGFNETMRIDLVLEVPAGSLAEIEDGSGDAEISGLGATTINDGSGNLRVSDMRGSLAVTDGSGNLDVNGVVGELEINDGSGDVDIADVRGNVRVTDGSGSIDVRGVRGNFTVPSDGSGGIDWANVDGRIAVPSRRD
jgi:hypothetical protein